MGALIRHDWMQDRKVDAIERLLRDYVALRDASLTANLEQEKRISALVAERDDLAAQLAAAQAWEPVPHGEVFFLPDTEPTADLNRVIVRLTDDLRLCRRRPQ